MGAIRRREGGRNGGGKVSIFVMVYLFYLIGFVAAEIESILKPWEEDSDSLAYSYSITVHGEPITHCNDR